MVRIKRGKIARKRRKKLLKEVKGYKFARKRKYRMAKEALLHALSYAFAHRRQKKRLMRREWQVKISAALKPFGLSYSKFIHLLKEKKVEINRKILAQLATEKPEVFQKIVEFVKS
jgi:large subunit ribosomal protein L20